MSDNALDLLRRLPVFADLSNDDDALTQILAITSSRSYPAGSVVINEGDTGDQMYIVTAGGVEIRKQTRAGDAYTVVLLRATDHVFFGEMALIDDDRRSATVVTTHDSEFLVISKADFLHLGDRSPGVALPVTRAIARILAGRLRKTTTDMMTIFDALVHELEES